MPSAMTNCSCNCNPCICLPPPGTDIGCLPISCVPRPCYFDGQLIGHADLNATVGYARNQQALLARFLGGFGILGGLKVDIPESPIRRVLAEGELRKLSNNPQIIASTKVDVSPGVAVDALGRTLVQCTPVSLDLQQLAQQSIAGNLKSGTCSQLLGMECVVTDPITVTEFFLIAEYNEVPERPAAQFSAGGPCDPAVSCEFSRKRENIVYSLVGCLPAAYQYTGCLEGEPFEVPDVSIGLETGGSLCRDEVFAFIDRVQSDLAGLCCTRPAVALARVLLTRDPGTELRGSLPSAPLYTILSDGYPCRRPIFQAGLFTKLFPNTICQNL
jgi:hypothetical protein